MLRCAADLRRLVACFFGSVMAAGAASGCRPAAEPGVAPVATASRARVLPSARRGSAPAVATGAHAKHAAANIGCNGCHPCGGSLQIASGIRYPGGTTTANAQVVPGSGATPATCQVGCHSPFGGAPHDVSWTAGPLECTDCHAQVASAAVASTHFDPTASSSSCRACHDLSQHTRGAVLLTGGDASDATCIACHSGQGETLGDRTPPLLVGWGDALGGDFHGERPGTCRFDGLDPSGTRWKSQGGFACPPAQPAQPLALRITSRWWYQSGLSGAWVWTCDIETIDESGARVGPVLKGQACPAGTVLNSSCNNPLSTTGCYPTTLVTRGFGGTVTAPFARGQGALPCRTCHDGHSSANAFLIASTVNGVSLTPATIDRAGVGAQALCNACHQGDRHEVCKSCHRELWVTDGVYWWFEGAVVDPVPDGSPCFTCHGHEGLLRMTLPSPEYPNNHPYGARGGGDACAHCHSGWAPPPLEYVAPVLSQAPVVTGVTATTATVTWSTDELATTYVEYGVGTAGQVAGDGGLVRQHTVTLTGLAPATRYVWRVRSSDSFRNVTESSLGAFTTPGALDVPWPDLAPVYAGVQVGTGSADVPLLWYPVTAPSGTAIEYEVQLASDAGFSYLVNGALAGPGVAGSTIGDSGWVTGAAATVGGKPALSYPASVTNIPQDLCFTPEPNVYSWRVRARDQQGHVSEWSATGTFGAFAYDPWC